MRIMTIFGTRPEAIKMAPVVKRIAAASDCTPIVCVTGQHRRMLDQVLTFFEVRPDYDLDVMSPAQRLNRLSSKILERMDAVLSEAAPDRVLVHGDTTTAAVAAMAAFHCRIPVGHVEAGLRTGDLTQPWPEEYNRRVVDITSDLLFAPTETARRNLLAENLGPKRIPVTGNTVVDALFDTLARIEGDRRLKASLAARFAFLDTGRRVVLVTGHRRENFGPGLSDICAALARIAERDDVELVYPVHLNPSVRAPVMTMLGGRPRIHLIDPLDYVPFVYLMSSSALILTDSGGIQEEAPSLGKPVLVLREVTERPEALAAGTVRLVGTDPDRIVEEVSRHLDDPELLIEAANRTNPYGDGKASHRIVGEILG
ncbi:MAG: non-hydrolyzing UDP-N-acetylglucosamine 2-epimerase [Alphaproteobacteria bacterium]